MKKYILGFLLVFTALCPPIVFAMDDIIVDTTVDTDTIDDLDMTTN